MTSEQPPRDALRPYRPLPSINIPLLREERSAVRSRRLVRVAIAATLVVATTGGVAATAHLVHEDDAPLAERPLGAEEAPAGEPGPEHAIAAAEQPPEGDDAQRAIAQLEEEAPDRSREPEPEAPALPVSPEAATRTQHAFGKAVSFRDALEKNGLSRDESNQLIDALGSVMDFRRSQPEHTFTVERDSQGKLVRFEYRAGLTVRYEAVRDSSGKLKAKQIQVPVKVVRVSKGGIVTGSLGDALEGLSLGRSLAGVFTEVFEGRINFSTDTRAGDTFRIILDEESVEDTFLRYGTIHALEYKGAKTGLLRAFWFTPNRGEDGDFYDENGRAMHGGWLRTPLRYDHISSPFGMRVHPVLKRKKLHNGIDYAAGMGTPVRAAASGTITFAGPKGANGNLLVISHAQGYETCYAHLLRFATGIKKGVKVSQRQVVAYVGSTGRSTGSHLHFSLKKNGVFIDPATQLNGPGLPLPAQRMPEFKRKVKELTNALGRVPVVQPAPVVSPPPLLHTGDEEL